MIKFWNRRDRNRDVATASGVQESTAGDRVKRFDDNAVRPLTQEEIDAVVTQVRQVRAARQGRRSDIYLRRKMMQREAETVAN